MLLKSTVRKYIPKRILDLTILALAFPVVISWVHNFQMAQRPGIMGYSLFSTHHSVLSFACLLLQTFLFVLFLYYSSDTSIIDKIYAYMNRKYVKEVDQQIVDGLLFLNTTKKEIRTLLTNSQKFDATSKKTVTDKFQQMVSRCVQKIEKAEKLRDDARRIPHAQVKKRLIEVRALLIHDVSKGVDEIIAIRNLIQKLESDPHLKKAQMEAFEKELDLKLKIAEKNDAGLTDSIYSNTSDTTNET